jgi:hypothetical protein
MMKLLKVCDKCREEVDELITYRISDEGLVLATTKPKIELCEYCQEILEQWLQRSVVCLDELACLFQEWFEKGLEDTKYKIQNHVSFMEQPEEFQDAMRFVARKAIKWIMNGENND